jgi:hypothetical protein
MFLHVTAVRYLHDYQVEVVFNNGRQGIADLSSALKGPVFEPLKRPAEFAKLALDKELETVAWPNGADLAPEFIYFQAFRHDPELQQQFRAWGYID